MGKKVSMIFKVLTLCKVVVCDFVRHMVASYALLGLALWGWVSSGVVADLTADIVANGFLNCWLSCAMFSCFFRLCFVFSGKWPLFKVALSFFFCCLGSLGIFVYGAISWENVWSVFGCSCAVGFLLWATCKILPYEKKIRDSLSEFRTKKKCC